MMEWSDRTAAQQGMILPYSHYSANRLIAAEDAALRCHESSQHGRRGAQLHHVLWHQLLSLPLAWHSSNLPFYEDNAGKPWQVSVVHMVAI